MNEIVSFLSPIIIPFYINNSIPIADTSWLALIVGVMCIIVAYKIIKNFFYYILMAFAIVSLTYAALINYFF